MNMIQKIALCAVLACAGSVSASTLFWQVDTADAGQNGYAGSTGTDAGAKYAILYATDNLNYSTQGADTKYAVAAYQLGESKSTYVTDLGAYGTSAYSFFVELVNNSGDTIYTQYTSSYDTLVSSGYVSSSALSVPTGAGSGGYNGASVPEPTSGMLLLMGASLLALRRRRQA